MKARRLSVCLLGLFTALSVFAFDVNESFNIAHATSAIEGYYAKASNGSSLNNIKFDLVENDAPLASYKLSSSSSMKLLKEDGSISYLPSNFVDSEVAFNKISATQYQISSTIFEKFEGGISNGDTIILDGDFISDNSALHIKESKLYVYTKDAVVTVPHSVNNISSYLDNVTSSKDAKGREWAFLLWADGISFDDLLRTVDDGYYPTSVHNVYVDGEPHANCLYDAIRRRDSYDEKTPMYEIYVCATSQVGVDNPDIGTLVVLDGVFNYKNYAPGQYVENPILNLEPGESYGIQIDLLPLLKVGAGVDDYIRIDLKSYLVEQFELLYSPDLFEPDHYLEINEMRDSLEASLTTLTSAKDIYFCYNYYVSQVGLLDMVEDSFQAFKDAYIDEIEHYVDTSIYWDSAALMVQETINNCVNTINEATTTKQVIDAVNKAKTKIDKTNTRLYDMEQAILNRTSGWENYLAPYDYVTLDDLSLGESQTFHGRKDERQNDIDTYDKDKNQINTFVPSLENKAGNVAFCFNYQADAVPSEQANVIVVLRGVKYYGYSFGFGTNTKGFYFTCTQAGKDNSEFEGKERCFMNSNVKTPVVVRAIDLIEGNRTWINVNIGGFDYLDKIVDSLSFCTNPRVSLRNNNGQFSDVGGTATISNYYHPKAKEIKNNYYGLFNYDGGYSDEDKILHLTLSENDLNYDTLEGVGGYAIRNTNIKLIRDKTEYNLGRTDIPAIEKYSETSYRLNLSKLFNEQITDLNDGDSVEVSGSFTYFDEDSMNKVAYEVGTSKFVYSASNKSWNQIVSLDAIKLDALIRLDNYLDEEFLSAYDGEEREQIISMIDNAKIEVDTQSSIEGVNALFNNAVNLIKEVNTSLQKYQQIAISLISLYKQDKYSEYRQEELELIESYKQVATDNISNASSREEIDNICRDMIDKIDLLLTDKELSEKELNEAKYQGATSIKNRYASLINDSMSDEDLEKLNSDTLEAIGNVETASTIEEVNRIVDEYLNSHELIPAPGQSSSSGCGGNVITSSLLISSSAASLLILLIIKKWKYKLMRRTNQ